MNNGLFPGSGVGSLTKISAATYAATTPTTYGTKPTKRPDNSALQIGDRWVDANQNVWVNTDYLGVQYWTSERQFSFSIPFAGITTTTTSPIISAPYFESIASYGGSTPPTKIMIDRGPFATFNISTTNNSSNHWTLTLNHISGITGTTTAIGDLSTVSTTTNSWIYFGLQDVSSLILTAPLSIISGYVDTPVWMFSATATKTGTAGTLSAFVNMNYRLIAN